MSSKGFEDFDAMTVPLEGSNLIEASAGTGKTYSVAILVLRLILEKRVSVKEILMVTFTKAAVAELEERIRLFIRLAYKSSLGEEIKDRTIAALAERSVNLRGEEDTRNILKEAVLFLDETSVLTIHSFCQLTLTEFAFETGQLFGAEPLQDTASLLEEEVNKFWRKYITTLPAGLLQFLLEAGLSRKGVYDVVKEHLDGKRYFDYDAARDYTLCDDDHSGFISSIRKLKEKESELKECLIAYISDNKEDLRARTDGNRFARKSLLRLIDQPEQFGDAVNAKKGANYIIELYPDVLEQCGRCEEVAEEIKGLLRQIISRLNCQAINYITRGVRDHKRRYNQVSFDDMIVNLHTALQRSDNELLLKGLRRKYKAVFVDEFQDTDRLQFGIFQKAFEEDTILFYIGDPKQSIYAWRKADIFTYFKACESVQHRYGMNINYRSSAGFIGAMNAFFQPEPGFDTFFFGDASHAIRYIEVESPAGNTKGSLYKGHEQAAPLSICRLPNKETVYNAVASQVADLLSGGYYLQAETRNAKAVSPADIGILVRANADGRKIKSVLAKYGIPAITIGDDKVLRSEEAVDLLYVLEAIADISLQSINRALLSPFTGYSAEDILKLDEEKVLELFGKYKADWDENGIYTALMDFVSDFSVQKILLDRHTENGERTIANLFQLIELLHKVQTSKRLLPLELISWLKRGIEGMETAGDEYEQRIESDEEAVKIVTIHKSKGLEYNIVLAPFLDFMVENSRPFCSFRDAETGEYILANKEALTEHQKMLVAEQAEQENRRLLYVAVTRAVYKCFIYKNLYFKESTLATFINALPAAPSSMIEFSEPPAMPAGYFFKPAGHVKRVLEKSPVSFELLEKNWRKMSYTMLKAQHETARTVWLNKHEDKYENFIFHQLAKGAKTGNLLHFIFENINFGNNSGWPYVIGEAIRRFVPGQADIYTEMLPVLLDHVLHVQLESGGSPFCLADVAPENQLHELEFDFRVPLFNPAVLESLSGPGTEIHVTNLSRMEGLMNGKIDLFFEWNNKFYVLDWKSNFLGGMMNDYSPDNVAGAMNANNYHLQYLLYTLAVKKYLESRLPYFDYDAQFGGVLYLFIRGIRKGSANGIFAAKPSLEKINRLNGILSDH